MENKIQQDAQNDLSHIFEIHTMKKDAQKPSAQKSTKMSAPHKEEKIFIAQEKKDTIQSMAKNPFLDLPEEPKSQIGTPVFDKDVPEKINQQTSDIAKNASLPLKAPLVPKRTKNTLHIVMIIFIIIFLIGAIVFGVYFFVGQRSTDHVENVLQETPVSIEMPVEEEPKVDTYATDLPNYFSFDVESLNSKDELTNEIDTISANLRQSGITEPIAFIVTDQKNNPVSFHVFAISAGLSMPQQVMESLEENFEIYAFNDGMNGVRFGFVVDVKTLNLLQDALRLHESALPSSVHLFFDDLILPEQITFSDSSYNGQPIRFANLDAAESFSVDYAIVGQKFVLGTSKNTLRAILDELRDQTVAPQDPPGFTY